MSTYVFNYQNLKKSKEGLLFIVDLFMLFLVFINIVWIIFDTLFISEVFQNGLSSISPDFTQFYKTQIHSSFPTYDMMFVAVFLTEFVFRWGLAIYRRTYHSWFFYPFIYWYDLLGCIPVGSMRWLRILRVFSIFYRLHKYKIMDFSQTYVSKVAKKYLNIVVEEVSDRVVINVLNGVQNEIKSGSPVVERISKEVLSPHKEVISKWVSLRINDLNSSVYSPRREEFKAYVVINDFFANPIKGEHLNSVVHRQNSVVTGAVSKKLYSVSDKRDLFSLAVIGGGGYFRWALAEADSNKRDWSIYNRKFIVGEKVIYSPFPSHKADNKETTIETDEYLIDILCKIDLKGNK